MRCPICFRNKEVASWNTCRREFCTRMYNHVKDIKIKDIDIKYIRSAIAKHEKEISAHNKELERLKAIRYLYVSSKKTTC